MQTAADEWPLFTLEQHSMNRRIPLLLVIVLAVATQTGATAQDTFLGRSADQWSELLTSAEGQKRVHAAWAIAQLAGRSAGGPNDQVHFAELVKLVSDNDPTVRYWGVMGLTAYGQRLGKGDGGQTAVVNTLEPLLDDKAAAPRLAAAAALGAFGRAEKAISTLVTAMSDPQESVRIQAVAGLEKLGPAAKSAEETLRRATTDSSEYVKRISARALARLDAAKK